MKKKAILSVEAAICIPIFFIASMLLISVMSIVYINERVEAILAEEAKELSVTCYDKEIIGVHAVIANIEDALGKEIISHPLIKNSPSGFDFSETDLTNPEVLKISVAYTITFPFSVIPVADITFNKSIITHTWVGYINGINSISGLSDYVYVTKNGSVYHKSRECSHIRLSIKAISSEEIKDIRNSGGAKYKKCEYCHPKETDAKLYISEDGDRYHNTLSCAGLKRTVYRIKLSEAMSKRPCMRCGY